MSSFEFVTVWEIDASISRVWNVIENADDWPKWWRGVLENVEVKKGDDDGVGSVRRSTWKSLLPYSLTFESEILRVEEHRIIEIRAFGDLTGSGLWAFTELGPERTRVVYEWKVVTDKVWMKLLSPVARPFFKWNHDIIMGWGEQGLNKTLLDIG